MPLRDHDYFATMLCALIDVDAHRLTVASAGHMPPLLIDGADGRFVEFEANVPIGVARNVAIPAEAGFRGAGYDAGRVHRRFG